MQVEVVKLNEKAHTILYKLYHTVIIEVLMKGNLSVHVMRCDSTVVAGRIKLKVRDVRINAWIGA